MRWSLLISSLTLVTALGLLACPGEVELESVEAGLFANGCEREPVVTVVTPLADQTFQDAIPVFVEVFDFNLQADFAQEPRPCEGHLHVFVDDQLVSMVATSEFTVDLTTLDAPLTPGEHALQIAVHTNRHEPITEIEPITIRFNVE